MEYRLVMLGAPGAGKGTQAARLSEEYGLSHISTGELFREAVRLGSEMGKAARVYMESGQLVPDEVTIGLVRERLAKDSSGFILDGFPRTVGQAVALGEVLAARGEGLTRVINIVVPEEDLIERAVGRLVCRGCGALYHVRYAPPLGNNCDKCGGELYQRADDTEGTVRRRLKVYTTSTRPLIEYYKDAGLYSEVDGRQAIDAVTASLKRVMVSLCE